MSNAEINKGFRILNIIWYAMLTSLVIYLFVGLYVAPNLKTSMSADAFSILRRVLYILAFIMLIIASRIKKMILSAKGSAKQANPNGDYPIQNPVLQKYATAMIAACAMSESIGIYGLVLFLLGKDVTDLYLLIFVSAAAIFMHRPKKDEIIGLSQDIPGYQI